MVLRFSPTNFILARGGIVSIIGEGIMHRLLGRLNVIFFIRESNIVLRKFSQSLVAGFEPALSSLR